MKLVQRLEQVALAAAVFPPALGSALAGRGLLLLIFLLTGVFWLGRQRLRQPLAMPTTLALLISTLTLAVAAGLEVGAGWLLLGMSGALAAWDLDDFARRLSHVDGAESEAILVQVHLQRLGFALLLGLTLGGLALLVQIDLGYGGIFLLVVLIFFALSRSITLLTRYRSSNRSVASRMFTDRHRKENR
jgi:hypothetical protein